MPVVQVVGEVEIRVEAPGQRVVEPCVKVPAVRFELLVTAAELDEPIVILVADEETAERQPAEPLGLSCNLRRNPARARNAEQHLEIAFTERDFPAGQDRDGDRDLRGRYGQRAAQEQAKIDVTVIPAAEEKIPRPPDVPLRVLSDR